MGRFEKGQSGNPSGRPKQTQQELDLIQACRKKAPKALATLEALLDSENESVALRASIALLERAYGKPRQEIDMTTNQPPEPPVFNVISFVDGKGNKVKDCRIENGRIIDDE